MISLNAYGSTIGLFSLSLCPNFSNLRQCIIQSRSTGNCKSHLLIFFAISICSLSLMILLIQSGDIEINPGPIQRVIRGSFHQGYQRFGLTAGTQCMCNALHSVGYSIIKKVRYWSTWDMDYILTARDSLYSSLGFRSQLLSVDELSDSICIENIMISIIKTNLETGLMMVNLGGGTVFTVQQGRKRQRETSTAKRTQLMPSALATKREQSQKRQQKPRCKLSEFEKNDITLKNISKV